MKIKRTSIIRKRIVDTLRKCIIKLENIGNANPNENGEFRIISNFLKNKDAAVIFDIGANIGEYTDYILKKRRGGNINIHLFEPQKKCFATLENKFKKQKGLQLNNFGLSSDESFEYVYKDTESSGLTSLYQRNLDYYNIKLDKKEMVELQSAKNYIKKMGIKHIDFIKIDVEGHELEVLKGFGDFLTPNNIEIIQFEYGGANLDSKTNLFEIYYFLEKRGFKIYKIMKSWIEPIKYHTNMENFIYTNYIAVGTKK